MAENQEPKEREIPVFTVLKNNCILKNIFLLDNPPPISSSSSLLVAENVDQESEMEEILLVGRHPDCNIKLEHPSISRFHLRIHSKPSSRSLFVTDLSSVHGTWISGKRIEPGIRMKLNEGDTLHLGASSRLYRFNWVPLSYAYDIDDPFVPQLDASDTVDEETEGAIDQDGDSLCYRIDQGQGLSDNMEDIEWLFSDKDIGLSMQKMSATAPPMPEDMYHSLPDMYHSLPDKDEVENNRSPEICNKENELSSSQLCQLDASVTAGEETEGATDQDGDSWSYKNDQGQGLSDNMEGLEGLFSEEDLGLSMQKMSTTAPPMPEDLYHFFPDKDEVENNSSTKICKKVNELSSSQLCQIEKENSTPQVHIPSAVSQTETAKYSGMNSEKRSGLSIWSRRGKPESVKIETSRSRGNCARINMSSQVILLPNENCISESMLKDQYASPDKNEEMCTPDKENTSPNSYLVRSLKCKFEETLKCESISNTPISNVDNDEEIFTPDKENVKPETSRSRGNCARINMSSRVILLPNENCISESMLKDQYASPDKNEEMFTPDKENTSPNSSLVRSLKCKFEETLKCESISNTPISNVDKDEEIFTPDKENVTPDSLDSHLLRSMKNIRRFNEVKHPNSYRPSPLKTANNSNMYQEEVMIPTSDKASQHHKVLQERKSTLSVSKGHVRLKKQPPVLKARIDGEPFYPLPVNSTSNHKATSIPSVREGTMKDCRSIPSVHEGTMKGCRSIKYPESEEVNQSHNNTVKVSKNRWTIIADTACLLNRKSRKELHLLRGLRGTTLVIPRIVIRELDCMLRRANFLSRMTEVSAALEWIEECMTTTKWWIHVQSSAEEGRLIPPTPPASPHWFSEDKGTFSVSSIPFSPYTLQEIVTPTAADHILECALFFRRTMNGQLVLLSDDVTLKIKAMAEGVICETAEEFRGSLVNPFSARFLYSNSSPIGSTWSCVDDTVLKEKYYPSPSKKSSKSGEGAKGLKLILLHNSNFRQNTLGNCH